MRATSSNRSDLAMDGEFVDFAEQTGIQLEYLELSECVGREADVARTVPISRRRLIQYSAGRWCAERAMERLGIWGQQVGRRDDGAPIWPSLVCGSISHSTEIVIAVVSMRRDHLSLGVDCEALMPFDVRTDLLDQISVPREREMTDAARLDADLGASLIFSSKESLYKCLWPLAGIFFDFSDACLTEVDSQRGTFQLQLTRSLASWEVGRAFAGRFTCLGDHVVTLIGLPCQSSSDV